MSKYDPAIDKGIALLDEKVPDWCKKMQLDHLHLRDPLSCVLGQVFGGYSVGRAVLEISDTEEYGFELPDEAFDNAGFKQAYAPLTRRWKQRIKAHCEAHS